MIWLLRNIILAIHNEKSRGQLAFGAVMGWFLGMVPWNNPIWLLLLLITLLCRANIAMSLGFMLLGKLMVIPFDTASVGRKVLEMEAFNGFFTKMYNTPYIALSSFNRSDVMGGLTCALLVSIITFPFLIQISKLYHKYVVTYAEKYKIVQVLKGSKLVQWYLRIAGV
jgi:uncharacterized protein (TIGR03546 family)